jgi:hypothetical protein
MMTENGLTACMEVVPLLLAQYITFPHYYDLIVLCTGHMSLLLCWQSWL